METKSPGVAWGLFIVPRVLFLTWEKAALLTLLLMTCVGNPCAIQRGFSRPWPWRLVAPAQKEPVPPGSAVPTGQGVLGPLGLPGEPRVTSGEVGTETEGHSGTASPS